MIKTNKFNKTDSDVKHYSKVFKDLSCTDKGILLKEDKIVIPLSLENKIIEIAHEGHMGLVKTKQLIQV